jgi:hypothetical protein
MIMILEDRSVCENELIEGIRESTLNPVPDRESYITLFGIRPYGFLFFCSIKRPPNDAYKDYLPSASE